MSKKKGNAKSPGKKTNRTSSKRRKKTRNSGGPISSPADFPIVVVGASAGGLNALKQFLSAVPRTSGIAFVLVPHLDPRHESMMVELLAKHTPMIVQEAVNGAMLQPDHVYIIPPNKYLAIKNRKLKLSRPPSAHGSPTAIDFALCSLAKDQGDAAIGIILSGTGSHGASGVREIKLAGGVVFAQDPTTAEFDQMPRSAIATGAVDYALAPEKMPEVLVKYAAHVLPVLGSTGEPTDLALDGLRRVLMLLQARTRHDFHHYRKNMIMRRIRRRMALQQIDDWTAYIDYLREHSNEITALLQDLLIGVTAFFRDLDAFSTLAENALPDLVERATSNAPVRVWVAGCASGEEAYSIAMLLIEQFKAADKPPDFQIFATDIDERSLETARQGIYPDSIAAALSPERLQRFFSKVNKDHFQVDKELRDFVVFAPQNLITDAPFSKLDLISCRNVLIYLEPEVQEKIISMMHFALKANGFLFLGPSETIGRASDMFKPVVKKWRLYRRIGPARRDLVNIPITASDGRRAHAVPHAPSRHPPASLTQLMQRLLADEFAPASALINRHYEILSVQGPLVNYLEFPAGEITKDLLAMARQGLRIRIRSACRQAVREERTVTEATARVRRNGHYIPCSVTVRPVVEPREAQDLLLVVFRDLPQTTATRTSDESAGFEETPVIAQLENELRATREDLQSTIEELKASNEEIMSMNEELQSTNEELETSKEELQSLNEELATVNNQLQDKVEDLDSANSDLTNLMTATGIPTLFLDADLRIKRFTPLTASLLRLVSSDIGRPVRDFAPRFADDELLPDAELVLKTLTLSEKEVCADDGRWYLRRILPYRSSDNRIEGVVVTFVDISTRIAAEAQARRLATVLMDSNDAVIVYDLDGQITAWNAGAKRMYEYSESKALKMNIRQLVPPEGETDLDEFLARTKGGEAVSAESKRITYSGRVLDVALTGTPIKDDSGNIIAIATTERDITDEREAQQAIHSLNITLEERVAERTADLQTSEQKIRAVLDATSDAIITIDSEGIIATFNAGAERIFGYTTDEAISQNVSMLMPFPYRDEHDDYLRRYRETGESRVIGRTRELRAQRKDGSEFPVQLSVSEIDHSGTFTGVIRDISDQRELQNEIVKIASLEQRRIGQELHDDILQNLTGLGLLADNLCEALKARGDTQEHTLSKKISTGISETHRHARLLAKGLVPVPISAEELISALSDLARRTHLEHGISCRFEGPDMILVSDDNSALHVYRLAQEAVANAVKHAKSDTISIQLENLDREIMLRIMDDGIGIETRRQNDPGLGLRIMEHRCGLLGGVFSVTRRPEGGTAVLCRIPKTNIRLSSR